jgi:hypothetical protein
VVTFAGQLVELVDVAATGPEGSAAPDAAASGVAAASRGSA